MESLPDIDVVNSSLSELLASPLIITIQQNVNEDNNSSSQIQEPMETIPVEQIDLINAKSQKQHYPDITADKPFMESGACPPFLKPSKQNEDQDFDRDSHFIFKTIHIPISFNFFIYDSNKIQIYHQRI